MNWDAIGAIGELLGATALFFVLVQVRQARKDSRRALSQGRAEAHRELITMQNDDRVVRLRVKANVALGAPPGVVLLPLMERAGLTREEATLIWNIEMAWLNYRIQTVANVDELPDAERAAFDGGMRASYGAPGVSRLFYETMKPSLHPDPVRYIDNLLAQAG